MKRIGLFIAAALVFLGPVAFLVLSSFRAERDVISAFLETQALDAFVQTLGFGFAIAALASLLGGFWGYVCASFDFPARRLWLWFLAAPLAIPVYVYAFVYLALWESIAGNSKPVWLLIAVFSLASYPYAFLLSYQAFSSDPRELRESAEMMALNKREYFWSVRWPLARPLVLSGFFIVLFEFIADFGAVQLFGLTTFSTSIYKLWSAYLSFGSAALVSLVLLVIVLVLLFFQSRLRGHGFSRYILVRARPRAAWILTLAALIQSLFAVVLPCALLLIWSWDAWSGSGLLRYLSNTAALSVIFALAVTSIIGLTVFMVDRRERWFPTALQFGYALPGTLLAVAVTVPFFYMQRISPGFARSMLIGLALMFLAWAVRFLKVAWEPIAKIREQIPSSIEDAANLYEPGFFRRWRLLLAPLVRGALRTSVLLLILEAAKELPIALLTRPQGWETLSIRIFEFTAESDWKRASPPALLIVAIGCIGLALLMGELRDDAGN